MLQNPHEVHAQKLHSLITWAQWHKPTVPVTEDAEAGESPEPRNLMPARTIWRYPAS